jgi:uncharacterized protein YjaZ
MKIRSGFLCAVVTLSSFALGQQQTKPALNRDPDAATISANDVRLFWSAYDFWLTREHGAPEKLAGVLQTEYLDKGSQGVKDFIPNRITSADHLAKVILKDRSYYEGVRRSSERMETFIPAIQKDLRTLKSIYPEAAFPAIYLVMGARNSGGTSSGNGLIIGAEMFGEGEIYPVRLSDVASIVVHELTHFQQKGSDNTLLRAAMREGAADFISEMVAGRSVNDRIKSYGDSHEQELWRRFQQDVKSGAKIGTWMYNQPPDGSPNDLGYYMGYKICQSYYQITADKQQALKTIIEMRSPEDIFAKSAYEKRFQ